jgi:hypothetical protein
MSATYAGDRYDRRGYERRGYASGGREERTGAGGFILLVISSLSAILVLAGLVYATGASQRTKTTLADFGCEPALVISGLPCTTQKTLIRQYYAVTTPAIQQLNADAAAYKASERHNLVAAEAALRAEVSTEQAFENSLAAVAYTPLHFIIADELIRNAESFTTPIPTAAYIFTPQITVLVNALIRDIQNVASLTTEQAGSTTIGQMRSFNARVDVATAAAQAELKAIRQALNVKPTASEEP